MIKRVQIIEVNSTHIIAGYPIDLVADDLKERGFKFEVQQPMVVWCNVFPPRRIPHAGF